MKKLLFVFAFVFIGQQAFSQIYIVTLSTTFGNGTLHSAGCIAPDLVLSKIAPNGNITYTCVANNYLGYDASTLAVINQELNAIISQGYKLIETNNGSLDAGNGLINASLVNNGTTWYFAIPWSASGLEEVATTLKSFIISPNPANTFVDISLDYSLKGESEVVFISEAGYISHKQSIGNISKNEKYNIDISKIPAGKYLVTIVNGKTYTTPQKLIVL